MPGRQPGADSAPERGSFSEDDWERPRSRAATIPEVNEPASPIPKRPLSLRSVRKGVLHVSEVSVPAPRSSDIFAQGEIFFPERPKDSGHNFCTTWASPQEAETATPAAESYTPDGGTSIENHPGSGQPTDRSGTASTLRLEQLTPLAIPDIQVQAPSDTNSNMGTVLGTGVTKTPSNAPKTLETNKNAAEKVLDAPAASGSRSVATVNTVAETASDLTAADEPASPAMGNRINDETSEPTAANNRAIPASGNQIAGAASTPAVADAAAGMVTATDVAETEPAPTDAVSNFQAAVPGAQVLPLAAPIDRPATSQSGVGLPPVGVTPVAASEPGGPPRGKSVPARQRVVKTARKVILRRKVLDMLLGRDLAGTVHPVLHGAGCGAE